MSDITLVWGNGLLTAFKSEEETMTDDVRRWTPVRAMIQCTVGGEYVLYEDYERLWAELAEIKVIREREAKLDGYRCRLIEELENSRYDLLDQIEKLESINEALEHEKGKRE